MFSGNLWEKDIYNFVPQYDGSQLHSEIMFVPVLEVFEGLLITRDDPGLSYQGRVEHNRHHCLQPYSMPKQLPNR